MIVKFKNMFISETLLESINQTLNSRGEEAVSSSSIKSVSGGSINSCYQLKSGECKYFLKVNTKSSYPGMFHKEAEGLKLIRSTGCVMVPGVISCGIADSEQFLMLQWIERGADTPSAQGEMGRALAAMHKHSNPSFGLDNDNYMGSLPQSNRYHDNYADFFIKERLEPQVEIAFNKKLIDNDLTIKFSALFSRLRNLFPSEKPALVHGDLWSGNYMINEQGKPVLIDPAVAYGHRETDIAMTALFGGFDSAFYKSYNESFPLERGWEQRIDLWNLYPLLIHLNLFGLAYLNGIKSTLAALV